MPHQKMTDEEKADRRTRMKEKDDRKHKEQQRASTLRDFREGYYGEPTRFFKVGDRLDFGAASIYETIVTEVIDDGMIYDTHQKYIKNNYGCKLNLERDMLISWMEAIPDQTTEENDALPVLFHREKIRIKPTNMCVMSIIGMSQKFGINADPDYQRGNVWTSEQKIDLIRSIFHEIDIGMFVLIDRGYNDGAKTHEILDGKQRYNAIIEFCESRFQYEGLYWHEMRRLDRAQFLNFHTAIAHVEGDLGREDTLRLFLKLNTGGKEQEKSHIDKVKAMLEEAQQEN